MSRRYLLLLAGITILAAVLALLGRPSARSPRPDAAVIAAPVVDLTLTIAGGRVTPPVTSVAKGSRVRLRVDHRGDRPSRLALAGYEDLITIPTLQPGAVWTGEFAAERPGDDFAWLLDGEPRGRLAVTGSHMVEGHR